MAEHDSSSFTTLTVRGLFFVILGGALLLNTLVPSRYLSPLIIIVCAIIMILYGLRLLGVHINIAKILHKLTKE